MTRAFLGLGSNLGDRLGTLKEAVRLLDERSEISFVRSSRVYGTEAVGGPDQPDFLNAVIEIETSLQPHQLLEACAAVEQRLGRVRDGRWGPRTIDIDLLNFDDRIVNEPDLVIPHPRLHLRAFALLPLLELEPAPKLPGGIEVGDARPEGDVAPLYPPLGVGRS